MASAKRYQDLVAWQRAMSLCKATYELSRRLPDSEKFGLVVQMRRAAVSVPSNIAEGLGRESTVDMVRFLRMARGSLFELATQIRLCVDLGFLSDDASVDPILQETDRVLSGLIKSIE